MCKHSCKPHPAGKSVALHLAVVFRCKLQLPMFTLLDADFQILVGDTSRFVEGDTSMDADLAYVPMKPSILVLHALQRSHAWRCTIALKWPSRVQKMGACASRASARAAKIECCPTSQVCGWVPSVCLRANVHARMCVCKRLSLVVLCVATPRKQEKLLPAYGLSMK